MSLITLPLKEKLPYNWVCVYRSIDGIRSSGLFKVPEDVSSDTEDLVVPRVRLTESPSVMMQTSDFWSQGTDPFVPTRLDCSRLMTSKQTVRLVCGLSSVLRRVGL